MHERPLSAVNHWLMERVCRSPFDLRDARPGNSWINEGQSYHLDDARQDGLAAFAQDQDANKVQQVSQPVHKLVLCTACEQEDDYCLRCVALPRLRACGAVSALQDDIGLSSKQPCLTQNTTDFSAHLAVRLKQQCSNDKPEERHCSARSNGRCDRPLAAAGPKHRTNPAIKPVFAGSPVLMQRQDTYGRELHVALENALPASLL